MSVIKNRSVIQSSKSCDLGLYSFYIGAKSYNNIGADNALTILKRYADALEIKLSADYTWHQSLLEIKNDSWGMVAISDFFADTSLPPLSMWDPVRQQLPVITNLIAQGNVGAAIINLSHTSQLLDKLYNILNKYSDRNQQGYNNSIEVLGYVQKGASIGVTIVGTAIAGPVGASFISTGYGTMVNIAQQSVEVHYHMRDKIDWIGISTDAVIDELMSLAAGKIADNIISQLNTQELLSALPVDIQQQVYSLLKNAPDQLKEKMVHAVMDKLGDVLGTTIKTVIYKFRDSKSDVTWKLLSDKIADQFSPMEIGGDIIKAIFSK